MQPDVFNLVKLIVILKYLAHCVYKPQVYTSTNFQTICTGRHCLSLLEFYNEEYFGLHSLCQLSGFLSLTTSVQAYPSGFNAEEKHGR